MSDFRAKMREKYGLDEPDEDEQFAYSSSAFDEPAVEHHHEHLGVDTEPLMSPFDPEVEKLGCFGRFASQWIFYVNLIFLLAGLGAVVYAVLLLTDAELLGDAPPSDGTAYFSLAIGSSITTLALLGIIGAKAESACMLKLYSIFLGVLVAVQSLLFLLVIFEVISVDDLVASSWRVADDDFRNDIQVGSNCCGLYEFDDKYAIEPCPETATDACLDHMVEEYFSVYGVFGYIFAAIGILQILTLIITACLRKCVQNRDARHAAVAMEQRI